MPLWFVFLLFCVGGFRHPFLNIIFRWNFRLAILLGGRHSIKGSYTILLYLKWRLLLEAMYRSNFTKHAHEFPVSQEKLYFNLTFYKMIENCYVMINHVKVNFIKQNIILHNVPVQLFYSSTSALGIRLQRPRT